MKRIAVLVILFSCLIFSEALAVRPYGKEGMPNAYEFMNEISKWTSQWNYYGIGESEVKHFHREDYDTLYFYSYFSDKPTQDENVYVPFMVDYNPDTYEIIAIGSPFKADERELALSMLATYLCAFYPDCNLNEGIKIMQKEMNMPESELYLIFHNENMVLKFMYVTGNQYFIQVEQGE